MTDEVADDESRENEIVLVVNRSSTLCVVVKVWREVAVRGDMRRLSKP